MPVRDAQPYLPYAVDSILNQSFTNFELIAIDDGSADESPEMLRAYEQRDPRVRAVIRSHRGVVATLNEGLQLARAPLVARMDADDIALKGRLHVQHRAFEADPGLLVLGTAEEHIDANGITYGRPDVVTGSETVAQALRRSCIIRHSSVMMRRQPILDLGGYRPAYTYAEDYDLWLRVIGKGKINNLGYRGLQYRVHAGNSSERDFVRSRISATLAQASHQLRASGLDDPTASLASEPALWSDPLLDTLIPAHSRFFRLVDLSLRTGSEEFDAQLARTLIKDLDPSVVAAHSKLWRVAMMRIARELKGIRAVRIEAALGALLSRPVHLGR